MYVYLVYTTSIGDDEETDVSYLYSIHKTLTGAIKTKKECQEFQKKYLTKKYSLKERVTVLKKEVKE